MSIRGQVAAAAVVAGVMLSGCSSAPAAPVSDEIKASAQARLDASQKAGPEARDNLRALGKTPDDAACKAAWDNLLASDQRHLSHGAWLAGCVNEPTP